MLTPLIAVETIVKPALIDLNTKEATVPIDFKAFSDRCNFSENSLKRTVRSLRSLEFILPKVALQAFFILPSISEIPENMLLNPARIFSLPPISSKESTRSLK